jgi:exopolysaccharide production protein ExoQ
MLLMEPQKPQTVITRVPLAARVTRVAFLLYVVFMLVGAAPPFRDQDLGGGDSNTVNRVVDSVIPLVCVACIWPKRRTLLAVLRREKFLTLFLLWCLASVLWSDFQFSSIKGAVRVIGSTTVIVAFFLNAESTTDAFQYIKTVLKIYIPLSFLAILLVPEATQWEWPAWRGLADHKNTLGQVAAISTVLLAYGIFGLRGNKRLIAGAFVLAATVLVLGSKSTTGLIALMSISFGSIWLFIDKRAGRLVACALIGCLLTVTVLGEALELDKIIGAFGKDTTFTGRTELWETVIDEAQYHPMMGLGFNGYWVADNPSVLALYAWNRFPWKPNEGHEGYLDLFNEIGIVGLVLLALMILSYFKNLTKLRQPLYWKWFFIGVLIINLTESTLFRAASFAGWMFIMSYLALYVELVRQEAYSRQRMPIAA